jgi:hypothetical protein
MRQISLRPAFVGFIPEQLEDGVIYISQRYRTATHRCCCGCGEEVVTPIGPTDWLLEVADGAVTLRPSIGNWSLPCRSHYLIRQGNVIWVREMSREEIDYGRRRDRLLRDAHFAEVNRAKEKVDDSLPSTGQLSPSWFVRLRRALRRWLGLAG